MRAVAIDLGASSGRAATIRLDDAIRFEENWRFPTPWYHDGQFERWDFKGLLAEIQKGLDMAGDCDSVAVDSWGVDFGLLDKNGSLVADPIRYRDTSNFTGFAQMPELYEKTGIQPQPFNTASQLLTRSLRERRGIE